jgi:osmotically-inducible protein OsmY
MGLKKALFTAGLGAAAAYFFDPEHGPARRTKAQDMLGGKVRQTTNRFEQQIEGKTQWLEDRAEGLAAERQGPATMPESDRVLVDKVRSECLGGEQWAPYTINVNAVDGVVTLRGQLDRPDQIRELRAAVAKVAGVRDVESFLHLPNTPAPNTIPAEEASAHAER